MKALVLERPGTPETLKRRNSNEEKTGRYQCALSHPHGAGR